MVVLPIFLALAATQCDTSLQPVVDALQRNDVGRASSLLASVPSECSQSSSYYALAGVTDEVSGKTDEAETAFLKAISLDPKSARLKEQLGAAYLRNKKPTLAAAVLHEAVVLDPTNSAAKKYLAGAYVEAGSWKQAAAVFDQLGGGISAASDPILVLWFGRTLIETRQFSRLDRELPPGSGALPSSLLFALGTALAQHGIYQKAVNYLSQIPDRDADEAVFFNLGLAYSHLRAFDQARRSYFLAIDRHPEHAEAYFRVGLDYGAAGDARRGIPWLLRARQWAPSRPDIAYAATQQLIQLGYFDTAEQVLAQDASGDPLLLVAKADLKQAKGDIEGAISDYRLILARQPDFSPALVGLARAYIAKGNDGEARPALLNLLAKDPADTAAQGELGGIEARQGNWDVALRHLRAAWVQDQSNPSIALDLVRAELHSNHPDEALKVLSGLGPAAQQLPAYHLQLAQVYTQLRRPVEAQEQRGIVAQLQAETQEGLHFDNPKTYVY